MPKTKFQDVIFTLLMVVVMVYALVVYNISLDRGGLTNEVFVMAFGELVIMGIAAFLLEMFLAGPLAKKAGVFHSRSGERQADCCDPCGVSHDGVYYVSPDESYRYASL